MEKKSNKAIGGKARAVALTALARSEIAKKAARARWSKGDESSMQAFPHPPDAQVLEGDESSMQAFPHPPDAQVFSEDLDTDLVDIGNLPNAIYWGNLNLVGVKLPCYVLDIRFPL